MGPALMTQKTIIVVVPLTILVQGHINDCTKSTITCSTFESDNQIQVNHAPSIIFVSVENSVQDNFLVFAKQLASASQLHCIVFDEVHLLLSEFQPIMHQVHVLAAIKVPIIGLTGKNLDFIFYFIS